VTDPLPAGASRSRLWRLPGALAWARAEGRPALGALLLYIAGAIALTASAWAAPTTRWIGSCCDPEQTIWFLRWVPYAIAHGTNPLFTGLLNAPNGVNLMWNASTPLLGLAALPITLLGGPILAYNVLMTVAVVLDAWCARLALQRYANGIVGPIVGGAVYGFSPFVVPHAALHLNLATALAPPLFLILLDEILVRRRRPAWLLGIAVGFVAAFQLLTAEELLATSAIAAIVFVGVLAACRPAQIRAGLRRLLPASVTAATTFILLAAWPLAAQFLGRQRIGGRVQDADSFATDLLNLVLPTRYQLIAPAAATQISDHFSGLFHEAGAYVGLPLLLVLAAVVARHWDDLRALARAAPPCRRRVDGLATPVAAVRRGSTPRERAARPLRSLPVARRRRHRRHHDRPDVRISVATSGPSLGCDHRCPCPCHPRATDFVHDRDTCVLRELGPGRDTARRHSADRAVLPRRSRGRPDGLGGCRR
jgi:hypothetical protein